MHSLSSSNNQSWLSWFSRGILIVGFLVLFARASELQIIKGSYYRALAEENRIRHIPIVAPRGKILARGGEVLVGNIESKKRIKFDPKVGYTKTDDVEGAPSEEIITDYKRSYLLGSKFSHVSGYVSEVLPEFVNKVDPACPLKGPRKIGKLVGVTGIEKQYDCALSGTDGEELIEVNTKGQKIRTLGTRESIPGTDLQTTIDFPLQEAIPGFMDQPKGAVVVTDTKGEVLALYSAPSFDPVNLAPSLTDPDQPFFDRAISGTFHPGSVFKPVVAVGALEEGKIDKNFRFTDTGVLNVKTPYGDFSYSNWYFTELGRTEGEVDLKKALARSTDTFFYKIGELLGPDKIANWAGKFGMNKKTGIDLQGESAGLVPTPGWKVKTQGTKWFLGNTYHFAIGQGDLSVTPIEMNQAISTIASGGELCRPHIAKSSESCNDLGLNADGLALVREGMKMVCEEGGTGYTFFDFASKNGGITLACKTGTAEVEVDGIPHAWFTFFGPVENPEIVTTVLVERGGEGSKVAGPIARKIADFYFQKNLIKND